MLRGIERKDQVVEEDAVRIEGHHIRISSGELKLVLQDDLLLVDVGDEFGVKREDLRIVIDLNRVDRLLQSAQYLVILRIRDWFIVLGQFRHFVTVEGHQVRKQGDGSVDDLLGRVQTVLAIPVRFQIGQILLVVNEVLQSLPNFAHPVVLV